MSIKKRFVVIDYRGFLPLSEAFERLGYRVLGSADALTESDWAYCELALYCMFDSIKSPVRSHLRKRLFNKASAPVITWNRDGPANKGEKAWRMWLLKNVPYFDIYATHTMQETHGFAPRVLYLPNAAWDTEYHLAGQDFPSLRRQDRYRYDVSFFGRINAARFPEMKKREDFFRVLEPKLRELGISYLFHDGPLSYAEQRKLIQTTRVNLNFHAGCDDAYHGGNAIGREKSWGMPERCFGVPACGGLLLSDERKHAQQDFSPGEDWVDFSDLDDCVAKIRYYLANFEKGRAIAEAAHRQVTNKHTYVHRAQTLIDAAEDWRRNRAARG